MTDRRPGPPLFELLNQDQPDQPDPSDGRDSQHPHPEPASPPKQAAPSPESSSPHPAPISAGVSRAERSAATLPDEPAPTEGGVHIPMPRVYLLIALTTLVMVLLWATAYKAGEAKGKSQMESMIPNKPSMILPPRAQSPIADSGTDSGTDSSTFGTRSGQAVTQPPSVPASATRAVMTAQGYVDQDPRVSGNNYLQLATFSPEQAADAILFMNDHSMPIIGVPVVDSSVRRGNNPSRYTLYSLGLAVPGGSQFSAMQAQRNEHKRAIAALGAQWQRERRGGSDFGESKTQWVKYN